jgi:hypothetical protein
MPRRKDTSAFNSFLIAALNVQGVTEDLAGNVVRAQSENEILKTQTNIEFSEKLHDMAQTGEYVRSPKFVTNNIEHIYPSTLKKIFKKSKKETADPNRALIRETPKKSKRVDPYDAAVILRMLVNGASPERVAEKFKGYSIDQIKRVKKRFWEIRTEDIPKDMHDSLMTVKRRRGHWV